MNYLVSVVLVLSCSLLTSCFDTGSSTSSNKNSNEDENFSQLINLSWNPTLEFDDGSLLQLSEITSYTLHWGRSNASQPESILIEDPTTQSYEFMASEQGDYYFAISVETIYGTRSLISNIVHKEVN